MKSTVVMLALSVQIVKPDCSIMVFSGSNCGGPASGLIECPDCIHYDYDFNGPAQNCTDLGFFTGASCVSHAIVVHKNIQIYTKVLNSAGDCVDCAYPSHNTSIFAGLCEQDTTAFCVGG